MHLFQIFALVDILQEMYVHIHVPAFYVFKQQAHDCPESLSLGNWITRGPWEPVLYWFAYGKFLPQVVKDKKLLSKCGKQFCIGHADLADFRKKRSHGHLRTV